MVQRSTGGDPDGGSAEAQLNQRRTGYTVRDKARGVQPERPSSAVKAPRLLSVITGTPVNTSQFRRLLQVVYIHFLNLDKGARSTTPVPLRLVVSAAAEKRDLCSGVRPTSLKSHLPGVGDQFPGSRGDCCLKRRKMVTPLRPPSSRLLSAEALRWEGLSIKSLWFNILSIHWIQGVRCRFQVMAAGVERS